MIPLTEIAHAQIRKALRPGDIAIDATVGNGHDTQFLAECVGPAGTVIGFDIQAEALTRTADRVQTAGLQNVVLLHRSHAEIHQALLERNIQQIRGAMFNLGYLPGGNKQLTTEVASTLIAVKAALGFLESDGMMTVIAYPGHPGGQHETESVQHCLKSLDPTDFEIHEEINVDNSPGVPRLFVVKKRLTSSGPKRICG